MEANFNDQAILGLTTEDVKSNQGMLRFEFLSEAVNYEKAWELVWNMQIIRKVKKEKPAGRYSEAGSSIRG